MIIRDWRWVLRYGWSVRFIVLAVVLTGLEAGIAVYTGYGHPPPFGIPVGIFAALASLISLGALAARFIAQSRGD